MRSIQHSSPLWRLVPVLTGLMASMTLMATSPRGPDVRPDTSPVHEGIASYTVVSDYQKGPNTVEVLLPDGYSPSQKYPVIYLLPVNAGTDGEWGSGIVEARRLGLHNNYKAIFVAPAYEVLPWYGDNPADPTVRQNSYITDVVVPWVEHEFSTLGAPDGRLLIGFSKSGLGAFSLFLQHPDKFGRVAVFDGSSGPPTQKSYEEWGFAATYGPRENYDRYDPILLLKARRAELSGQPARITLLAGGPGSRIGVDAIRSTLQDLHIPFVYILGSNMAHTWTSGWLPLAVAALLFPPPAGSP